MPPRKINIFFIKIKQLVITLPVEITAPIHDKNPFTFRHTQLY